MKKLTLLIVFMFLLSYIAHAETIGVLSEIHPSKVIDAIKEQPHKIYFSLGKLYFNGENYEKAIEMFEKTVKYKDDYAPAYHNLGVAYYSQGEGKKALEYFKKAVEVDKDYSNGHYSLGILYFENMDFDNAINSLEIFAKLEPNNPNANFDLAQSYVARFRKAEDTGEKLNFKDLEQAEKYLKNTLKLDPNFPYAKTNLEVLNEILKARKELTNVS